MVGWLVNGLEVVSFFCIFPLHHMLSCLGAAGALVAFGGKKTRAAMLGYALWAVLDQSHVRGGFAWAWTSGVTGWLRRLSAWRLASRYVPTSLIRTAPLDPEAGPYIFVIHPHGIIGVAGMTHFGTEATGFSEKFPGVPVHLLGHSAIFRMPFFREWCLLHGHGTVAKPCCLKLLRRGHSIALAPGGAKESLECAPGSMRLILNNRKGFVRLAVETGASIVPTMSFGENELYHTVQFDKGTRCRAVQDAFQARLGFALPIFFGSSWLFPLLPRRIPLATVVGEPVRPVPGESGPEAVDALHARYCEVLRKLFDSHKAEHGLAEAQLELI